MGRGSQSQSSTMASSVRGSGAGSRIPRSTSAKENGGGGAGLRRRRAASTGSGALRVGNNNLLRFYTDDAPGVKITPAVVLIVSFCLIAFVTCLHVVGKLYMKSTKA